MTLPDDVTVQFSPGTGPFDTPAWEDIPTLDGRCRLMSASWENGRTNELEQFPPARASLVFRNHDRLLDPEHTTGAYYGDLNPRVPVKITVDYGISVLTLPASPASYASTPNHSSIDITGDIDVRIDAYHDTWRPASTVTLLGKWLNPNQSYAFRLGSSGLLQSAYSTNGTNNTFPTSNAAVPSGAARRTIRWTFDVDNGAGQNVTRFYTGPTVDGPWTLLGTDVTLAGVASIFNGNQPLVVGAINSGGASFFVGQVYRAQVRNGIDGVIVADADFTDGHAGQTSFTDTSGRVWSTNGGATLDHEVGSHGDQYFGFVDKGWRQTYQKPQSARCEIECYDLLAVLNGEEMPASAYDAEVLADSPSVWWRLDETAGTQMADSSGYGRHGVYQNGELGQDPLLVGSGHSFGVPLTGPNRGSWSGEGLPAQAPATFEAWVKFPRDLSQTHVAIAVQRDSAFTAGLFIGSDDLATGQLTVQFLNLGGRYIIQGDTRIDDDTPHHIAVTIAGTALADINLYVDGVAEPKSVLFGSSGGTWTTCRLWTVGNGADLGSGTDYGLGGHVDEVAVYPSALSASRIAAHYAAGTTAFEGELTGARIDRVLDIVGVPAGLRDIAAGDTTAGPFNPGGQSAGQYLSSVVESEQGVLFVDHRNGGVLKFRGRYHRFTETRSLTSQATFTDDPDSTDPKYKSLEPEPNSAESVINTVEVSWPGGTELVTDSASRAAYGPQSRSIATDAPTPQAAQSAGQWMLARYSTPRPRVRFVPIRQSDLSAVVNTTEVADRVTVRRHPNTTGAVITSDAIIEGTRTDMNADQTWSMGFHLSEADDVTVWLWGVSAWGVDNFWG